MKVGGIILKNSGVLVARQIFLNILALVTTAYIARCLGEVDYGKFAFAFAFVALFKIVGEMGVYSLTVREVAKNPGAAGRWLGDSIILRAFFSCIMLILILAVIRLMEYPEETKIVVWIAAFCLLLDLFTNSFSSMFEGFQRMEFIALLQSIASLFQISLAILVLYLGYRLIPLMLVYLAGSGFSFILGFIIISKYFTLPQFTIDVGRLKKTVSSAFPFALITFFLIIMFKLDIVMLSIMKGDAAAGWYNAATVLAYNLIIISTSLSTSLFPAFARLRKENPELCKKIFEKVFHFLLLIGLPIAIGTAFTAKKFILLIYGGRFEPSILILQIIVWYIPLVYIGSLLANVLNAYDRQKVVAKTAGIQALANILMNLVLIPEYGAIGAALATILTEAVGLCFLLLAIKEYFAFGFIWKKGPIVLLCNLLLGLFLMIISGQNLALVILFSIVFYFCLLFVFKTFDREDIGFLKRLMPRAIFGARCSQE